MTATDTELAPIAPLAADVVEGVLLQGDLAKLKPHERVAYMQNVCRSLGLNPLTKPFEFISLNNKLVMYAKKDATEQLRSLRRISLTIVAREVIEGVYVVTARATDMHGRTDESIGAVPIEGLKGEARSNAMMKAETKAKRRVTLSISGLGMLDESETDSIPGARRVATEEPIEAETVDPQYRETMREVPSVSADYVPGNQVPPKSPGKLLAQGQNAEIHVLLKEIGWPDETYRKALGAYKQLGGKRVEHATELQEHQADNLLKRMRAQRQRNDARARQMAQEMAQNVGELLTTVDAPAPDISPAERAQDTGEAATEEAYSAIETRMTRSLKWAPERVVTFLRDVFGRETVRSLTAAQADACMLLVSALVPGKPIQDCPAYVTLYNKLANEGRVA